ncbi:PAS domain S-box protein [Arenibacter sp. GZD96]|uniref:PAS domain-containing protein n=1 Tax=Aurantibrevibacter litoralis TaxID=3106030 RepID=UPI002AFE2D76|nr:PAS domain-containing protein [Arenibacter sp. GZD-96]MEA1786844.1 PAS domain S-box protein [Arenibacter sp. GZD-96]
MIKEAETKSRNYLIKQLPSATVFLDMHLQVVHVSDKWISDFNFVQTEVIGKSLHALFGAISSSWQQSLENCLNGLCGIKNKYEYTDEDGTTRFFDYVTMPWYDTSENIMGVIMHTTPISTTQRSELERDKLQLLLDTQSEISKIGSWEYIIDTQKLYWCKMTKKIHKVPFNFKPTIVKAMDFYKEGYSRNTISMAMFNALNHGTAWSEKLQIRNAKGEEIWVIAAGKPIYKEGKIVSIIGTFQDINEQIINDIKTRENEKLLKTLIDNLPLNVYIKDLDSRKVMVNKSECRYIGVSRAEELLGKNDFDVFDEKSAQNSREEDLRVLNTLNPILGQETICVKKDGQVTSFLTSKIPLIGEDGNAYGLVGISMDISNLKQKEETLRNLIHVTSQQNKKLINFAHIVSHNLRSHAANFSMLLQFMQEEKDVKERCKITEMLVNASDNLMETLDNLNEVVAISRNIKLEKKPVNLNEKINRVTQNLDELIRQNNVAIVNKIAADSQVLAIPEYLESILTNFITNAIRYRRPDALPLLQLSTSTEGEFTVLHIKDNGRGIDLKKYGDKLFGMYKTFHKDTEGRGIGLYITKNQIEAMNGKIETESEVGVGTTFKIYFNDKK